MGGNVALSISLTAITSLIAFITIPIIIKIYFNYVIKDSSIIIFNTSLIGASFKTYQNANIRKGQSIGNPTKFAQDYLTHVRVHFDKEISKLKRDDSKEKLENKKNEYLREFKKEMRNLINLVSFIKHVTDAKLKIVKKLNSVKGLTDTFIRTDNGYKVTNPEGYVAIDRATGGAVKLVDRMEFSFNNFTAIKAWDK